MSVLSFLNLKTGVAAAALMTLAACGGADDTTQPDTPAEVPAETMEPVAVMPTITPNKAPLPSSHPNSIQPETTLSISADGSVAREPDIAFIMTGVESQAATAQAAMKANRTSMNGVFTALEAAKVAKKDMQTSNFSLQPRYDYSNRKNGEPPRLVGYTASNQLSVKVRDLDNLGATMDALVEAGGNTFSGLRFALNDDRSAKDEARAIAMREAVARAELYAKASGYEVARIVTINESGGYQPQPVMMARSMTESSAATPIAGGEVNYSVTVNVVFELRK